MEVKENKNMELIKNQYSNSNSSHNREYNSNGGIRNVNSNRDLPDIYEGDDSLRHRK